MAQPVRQLHQHRRDCVAVPSGAGVHSSSLPMQLCLVPISRVSTTQSDIASIDSEACRRRRGTSVARPDSESRGGIRSRGCLRQCEDGPTIGTTEPVPSRYQQAHPGRGAVGGAAPCTWETAHAGIVACAFHSIRTATRQSMLTAVLSPLPDPRTGGRHLEHFRRRRPS